jgi:type III restriction enzyme
MKLHFDDCYTDERLAYQRDAIESICDLFRGQEICRSEFTVTFGQSDQLQGMSQNQLGIGNRLALLDDEILANLRETQLGNGLEPSDSLASGDFTVEMETGTGKTYVYLRSIFELHKRYGFTKFVIVVPSVAIKEGVYKSIEIMEEHLRSLYANEPFEYFIYDSSKLGQVRNFSTSPNIQIMVVTVGAINKKEVNNLYKDSEKTGGEKPIDLIKATRPVIIVDEPQSVDGGLSGAGKTALGAMNPLCTLRYSATHADKHNMVYRLDAIDAYEKKLVKQIEIAAATVEGGHNSPYVKLVSVANKANRISAKVELDVDEGRAVARKIITVKARDDLAELSGRDVYKGFLVENIGCRETAEFIQFTNQALPLPLGVSLGGVDEDAIKRRMIRRTIEEHLEKELRLAPQGIKVLSLFFIDRVEHYRSYSPDGRPIKGKYAIMFEEEYRNAMGKARYVSLFKEVDTHSSVEDVHNGYFSIDKKGGWAELELDTEGNPKNQSSRENAERAYHLIMTEKEKLLSFETPLKFIFSHSALREGWDNPNVFQICALRDMGSERERRQTIGRGLRLCVNQEGQRLRGHEVNTLTVVATESYEVFAENLQKEIERDTGIRFGIVGRHQFAAIGTLRPDGRIEHLGVERSQAVWDYLRSNDLIDTHGKVQDNLRKSLKEGTFELPAEYSSAKAQIAETLKRIAGKLEIKNADERRTIACRRAVLESEEFRALWERIKHKTTYRVIFDNAILETACIASIKTAPPVPRTKLTWRKADIAIGKGGVGATGTSESAPEYLAEKDIHLPDILTELQDKTQLTRKSLSRIIIDSGRLEDFKANPQAFIDLAAESINRSKRLALVDGIKYQRVGDEYYYAQELFMSEELTGYLRNTLDVRGTNKSVYEYIVYDSPYVERGFAEELEKNEAVKVYAKLPGWFQVSTPLGSYNPDWAILVNIDGPERLYFVVETKGSLFTDDLRDKERAKIECGKAHFKALGTAEATVHYVAPATKLADVFEKVGR